ncbi:MAG: hypothetical protein JSW06_11395 [Thermoplasmatales archaeon]|nr:MAG: hypothetical protein JSW06_11395 [Thermoplasmatales archaeon]
MKKTPVLLILLLLSLFSSAFANATIVVDPLELMIRLDNEFIHGNTSKNITIINKNDYSINVTWYLEHPNPISYLRPNRTFIPDLSWVNVEPKWLVIPPASAALFYIQLNIPEIEELLDQHWETWVTFQLDENNGGGGVFEYEYAIRVYIDTPYKTTINNSPNNNSNSNYYNIYYIFIAGTVITLTILVVLFYKKKMKKK